MTGDASPEAAHLMPRGESLQHSLLVLIVGASCLVRPGRNVRTALGAESPKPPLTEENLNQFIAVLRKGLPPDSEALKTQATRDWRALLWEQFTLTSIQKKALEGLPRETVHQVQEAIREAIHTNMAFNVGAVAAEGTAPAMAQASGGTSAPPRSEEVHVATWTQPDAPPGRTRTRFGPCFPEAATLVPVIAPGGKQGGNCASSEGTRNRFGS
jgi:hypothetical protein